MKKRHLMYILIWLMLWEIAARLLHNEILLVGPLNTLRALTGMLRDRLFYQSVLFSMLRICCGFLLGSFLGVLLAWVSYSRQWFRELMAPLVNAIKAVPVASFVILLLTWMGNRQISLGISALVSFPILYLNTLSGLESTDRQLLEMAQLFHMPTGNRLRYIYLPALTPQLRSALQLAVGMSWKSGVAAEVIGQPLGSVGNGLYRAKILLETGELFAWTLVTVLLAFLMEKLILAAFEKLLVSKRAGKGNQGENRGQKR